MTVSSWVAIREGCPMTFEVLGSGETHFLCGTTEEGFEFNFEADALREFLRLGGDALAQMDTQYAEEEARDTRQVNAVADVATAGKRSA